MVAHTVHAFAMPAQLVIFWSRSRDNGLVLAVYSDASDIFDVLSITGLVLLLYRDTLAELAESRSKNRARWTLQREFAAFMSHYKNGARSCPCPPQSRTG